MSYKILITISDELKVMIDKYNQENLFEPLHISEIAQKAIFEKITSLDKDIAMEKTEVKKTKGKSIKKPLQTEPETSHKAPIPIHEIIYRLHSEPIPEIQEPVKKEPEPLHKVLTPIHEHIEKLHSEPIPEPIPERIERVDEANFFDNEPDTTEGTKEESIHEIQTYKGKNEPTLIPCEVCGKLFPAKTKRARVCSPKCREAKSQEKGKDKAGKK